MSNHTAAELAANYDLFIAEFPAACTEGRRYFNMHRQAFWERVAQKIMDDRAEAKRTGNVVVSVGARVD